MKRPDLRLVTSEAAVPASVGPTPAQVLFDQYVVAISRALMDCATAADHELIGEIEGASGERLLSGRSRFVVLESSLGDHEHDAELARRANRATNYVHNFRVDVFGAVAEFYGANPGQQAPITLHPGLHRLIDQALARRAAQANSD